MSSNQSNSVRFLTKAITCGVLRPGISFWTETIDDHRRNILIIPRYRQKITFEDASIHLRVSLMSEKNPHLMSGMDFNWGKVISKIEFFNVERRGLMDIMEKNAVFSVTVLPLKVQILIRFLTWTLIWKWFISTRRIRQLHSILNQIATNSPMTSRIREGISTRGPRLSTWPEQVTVSLRFLGLFI